MKPLAAMIAAILLGLTGGCTPSYASEAYELTDTDRAAIAAYGRYVTPGRMLAKCGKGKCYDLLTRELIVSDNLQDVEGYLLTEDMEAGATEVR